MGGKACWRTSFASAYPPRLCLELARLFKLAIGTDGLDTSGQSAPSAWWENRLATARGCELDADCVVVRPLPYRRLCLGWEGGTKQWAGRPLSEEIEAWRVHQAGLRAQAACAGWPAQAKARS